MLNNLNFSTMNTIYKYLIFSFFTGIFVMAGCKDKDDLGTAPRLFRPILECTAGTTSPFIEAEWTDLTATSAATSFTLELSTDTFATIVDSVVVDTCAYTFTNLTWDLSYQVRVKCNGDNIESEYYTVVGVDLTFPTFLKTFTSSEIMDVGVRAQWNSNDSGYTSMKVFLVSDGSLVKETEVTATDTANKYLDIYGLEPSTGYKVVAYSNGRYQGYKAVTTVASQDYPISVDLRSIDDATAASMITTDYLSGLQGGTVVILKRGMSYTISSTVYFGQSVTFTTGLGFGDDLAVLDLQTGNFDLTAGSAIDSVKFLNINLIGKATGYAGKYILNVSTLATLGSCITNGCKISGLRGMLRVKTAGATVNNQVIYNCIIDSIAGYGITTIDVSGAYVKNITLTNSTVSDAQRLFANTKSANGIESIDIENCTFCYAPLGGTYMFDFKDQTMTSGITINNSIWGPGKTNSSSVSAVYGYRGTNINVTIKGNYMTSDLVFTSADISFDAYSGTAAELFLDPTNDDFTINDDDFGGKSTAGDPRWRP
jgi:hypothetical protein